MDKVLRFWVDVEYERRKWNHLNMTKRQLLGQILQEFERRGDAMRYLNANGKIGWKSSPSMLQALEDAEREVEQDLEEFP
jgi:hypothetical protein